MSMGPSPSLLESVPAAERIASFSAMLLEFGQSMFIEVLIMLLVVCMFVWQSKSSLFRARVPVGKISGGGKGQNTGQDTSKVITGVQQEKGKEAQQVQMFVVSLLQKGNKTNPSAVLKQYEELARSCRGNLRQHIRDDQHARSMYLALISCAAGLSTAVPQRSGSADRKAVWQSTNQLLSDMRAFGFPRNADFYDTALKIFGSAQLFQEGLWLHDAMTADGRAPGNGMLVLLMTMAVSCGELSKALAFFDRIIEVSQPSPRTVMTVLRAYSARKDWLGATKLLDRLACLGYPPDNLILNSVLGLCVSCFKIDGAQTLLQRWKDVADVVSCNIYLKACTQLPDVQRAEAVLEGMIANGPAPNLISYNTVMDCAVRAMQTNAGARDQQSLAAVARRSWELIDDAIARGLEPDRYTCSTLVKGMHLTGCTTSDIDRAVDMLNRIGADALQEPLVKAKEPHTGCNERLLEVLFNTLLDACISVRDLDRMKNIFAMMQQFGVNVSAVTYGTLIKAFGQSGLLNQCHKTWEDLRRSGVRPTIVTFGCYIDACIRNNDIEHAEEIFKTIGMHGVRPNAVIYTSLIRGFASAKQPRKCLELYRRMREDGIEPTSVTFKSMLDIVARQLSEPAVLQEIIDDMCKFGTVPDVNTYSSLITAACSAGNIQNALSLFKQLQSKGLAFDQVAFNTLLLACSKAEQVADAEDIFEEMCRLRMMPTHVTASIMVKMYGKARMLSKAIGVTELLEREYGQTPNLYVFTCLIQACTQNRQTRKGWEIFSKMLTSGVEPDAVIYGTMIHGCVHINKFTYAMSLVRHAYKTPGSEGLDGETQFLALPALKHVVPLQQEVLQMLLAALQRKEQKELAVELHGIMASHVATWSETGKSQGGRHTRGARAGN